MNMNRHLCMAAAAVLLAPVPALAGQQPPTFWQWLGASIPIFIVAVVIGLASWHILRLKGWKSRSLTIACFIPGLNYLTLFYAIGVPDMIVRRRIEEVAAKCGLAPAQDESFKQKGKP